MDCERAPRPMRAVLVFAPFLAMAALFGGAHLLALHWLSGIRSETDAIAGDMLTSIQLVSRMRRDMEQVRILAEAHVLQHEPAAMAVNDTEIQRFRDDFVATAQAYEPLTWKSGALDEQKTWARVKALAVEVAPPLDSMLAQSSANRDAEARQAFMDMSGKFDEMLRGLLSLIDMSRVAVKDSATRVGALQRSAAGFLLALSFVGVGVCSAVGVATARLIWRRQRLQLRYVDALAHMNRDLDAFAGSVAHDLRAPLTAATLATTRLAQQAPEQSKTTEVLWRSLVRMQALIEDLLELSRMQAGAPVGFCNPGLVAIQVRDEVASHAREVEVALEVDVRPANVRYRGELLRQVVWNLVDNAIKYRRHDVRPWVTVQGQIVDGSYELSVSDNGIGMSANDVTRAFDPFYRALRARSEPGTGLGLSIVKRVVEAGGGSLSVTSEVGAGSKFVVRLPCD
jgi:signal transduction histidine kinase